MKIHDNTVVQYIRVDNITTRQRDKAEGEESYFRGVGRQGFLCVCGTL